MAKTLTPPDGLYTAGDDFLYIEKGVLWVPSWWLPPNIIWKIPWTKVRSGIPFVKLSDIAKARPENRKELEELAESKGCVMDDESEVVE